VLSAVQGLPQSTQWSENQELCGYQRPNLGILLLELHRPVWRYCLFDLAGWRESPEVCNSFRSNLLPVAIQCCEYLLVQGLLYVYYAVHYAVWLLLFLDTKRGLLLTVKVLQKMQGV